MILTQTTKCAECGAQLLAGAEVRGPYRNGAVYGTLCHAARSKRNEPLGQRYSRYDRRGLYTAAGVCIARVSCGCEDYPCCGH